LPPTLACPAGVTALQALSTQQLQQAVGNLVTEVGRERG
jgi:hypothetical protein